MQHFVSFVGWMLLRYPGSLNNLIVARLGSHQSLLLYKKPTTPILWLLIFVNFIQFGERELDCWPEIWIGMIFNDVGGFVLATRAFAVEPVNLISN